MVAILSDEVEAIVLCILPEFGIWHTIEIQIKRMASSTKVLFKETSQTRRQIVVDNEFHAAGGIT